MPAFPFSQALTANQRGFNPLLNASWPFETIPLAWPRGAVVSLLSRATTAGVQLSVQTGSTSIQQRSPVQAGGTAGVTPSSLNTTATKWVASPGDRLVCVYDEVLGGTPTVDGIIEVEPI